MQRRIASSQADKEIVRHRREKKTWREYLRYSWTLQEARKCPTYEKRQSNSNYLKPFANSNSIQMIGFQNELNPERDQSQEESETKNLEKKEIYDMLLHKYYLPPYSSRGVTREYLLKVYHDKCYRVHLLELKHFEVELTTKMTRRIGIQNNGLLVKKLNFLLSSKNMNPLGFDEYDPPEQVISSD